MKALREAKELLVDVKIDVEKEGVEQFGYIETKLEIIIAELEALQKPRSCDGCKYGTAYFGTDRKWCEANIQQDGMTTVDKDFCCNRYEAKEQ